MQVTNFSYIFGRRNRGRLIHGTAYTRVCMVGCLCFLPGPWLPLGLYQILALALAENLPFLQIWLQPKCSQISVLGRICNMAHTNLQCSVCQLVSKICTVCVAIFAIHLIAFLRYCRHLMANEILRYEYPLSLSSFMNKSRIQHKC